MSLVDTHCHIDLYPDYQQVVKRVEAKQIYTVAVTTAPSVYRQSNSLYIARAIHSQRIQSF